jgi:ATP-dependent Zn protease
MTSKSTRGTRPSRKEKTAYHEAGHAVIAAELRIQFNSVSVIADDDSLGHILIENYTPSDNEERANLQIEKRIMVDLAGMAAEHKLNGRDDWRGAASDLSSAIDLAEHRFRLDVAGAYITFLKMYVRSMMDVPFTWGGS